MPSDAISFTYAEALGGGTVGTAKLLLRSREFMPLLSRHVGKNIASNGSIKVGGILPEGFIEGDMLSGRSHPGMISYQFLESLGITISAAKPLPLQLVASAHLKLDGETRSPAYWGEANVELMKLYRRRMIVLYALGLTPPTAEIQQTGQNTFKPALSIDGNLRRYYARTKTLLHTILIKNGCKVMHDHPINGEGKEYDDLHFSTTHMVGSCRMADRKQDGVVNALGEVWTLLRNINSIPFKASEMSNHQEKRHHETLKHNSAHRYRDDYLHVLASEGPALLSRQAFARMQDILDH